MSKDPIENKEVESTEDDTNLEKDLNESGDGKEVVTLVENKSEFVKGKRVPGMTPYIGVKIVNAKLMTRGEYNSFRGWSMPADENGEDTGYLVQYPDAYVSWCPTEQFEDANSLTTEMPFGHAVEAMRMGRTVARKGWNGKDMFIFLVPGSKFQVNRAPLLGIFKEGTVIDYCEHIDIRKADGSIGTWSPSNSDALATDWVIV